MYLHVTIKLCIFAPKFSIMKKITTDNFTFESLRQNDTLYVDKTQYVWELVSSDTKNYFLSRPRRFGKSLLLSTLEAFFQGKRELFNGLAIDKLAPDDVWQEWPVIHLDMSKVTSPEGFEGQVKSLNSYMQRVAESLHMDVRDNLGAADILDALINFLRRKAGKPVAILVDEYDKPILDALHTQYVDKTVAMMQGVYQMLKSNNANERFVFITGVTKFAHTSLFSGVNNLTDITQRTEYATMLGYTEQELRDNFSEYIDLTAGAMNMDRETLFDKMKRWYDGFRFTSDSAHVFNPVSVGKFFQEKKFKNYWFATGTPTFLVKQMRSNPFMLHDFAHEWTSPMFLDKYDATSLEPKSLALQTGYITIAEVQSDDFGEYYRYDFPNEEIRMSWNDCMLDIASANYMQLSGGRRKMYEALHKGDIDTMMKLLKSLFAGVTKDHLGIVWEGYYRNMIYMLFSAFGVDVHAEEQVAGGIVDIVIKAYDQAYVFELKVSQTGADADVESLLSNGFDQAQAKSYADKYHFDASKVHVISVVFDHNNHQLVAWRSQQ